MPRFTTLGVATVHDKAINTYVITPSGGVIIDSYEEDGNRIGSFLQFTESGMMRATDIQIDGVRYQGIINAEGEMEWLFGEEPKEDAVDVDQPPIGPIQLDTMTYIVTVKCEPAEGGSATISPGSRFLYGQEAILTATPNEGWAITHVDVHEGYFGFPPELDKPFNVTEDMEITVYFAKEDDEREPPVTNTFAGVKSMDICKEYAVDVTIYAELSAEADIATPYGDNTYGFIVAMFDPTHRFVIPNVATYIFGTNLAYIFKSPVMFSIQLIGSLIRESKNHPAKS
jgi:hypothetical protein